MARMMNISSPSKAPGIFLILLAGMLVSLLTSRFFPPAWLNWQSRVISFITIFAAYRYFDHDPEAKKL